MAFIEKGTGPAEKPGEEARPGLAGRLAAREQLKTIIGGVKTADAAYAQAEPGEKKEIDSLYSKIEASWVRVGASMAGAVASVALADAFWSLASSAVYGGKVAADAAAATGLGVDGVAAASIFLVSAAGGGIFYFGYEVYRGLRDWAGWDREKNAKLDTVRKRASAA